MFRSNQPGYSVGHLGERDRENEATDLLVARLLALFSSHHAHPGRTRVSMDLQASFFFLRSPRGYKSNDQAYEPIFAFIEKAASHYRRLVLDY